MMDEEYGMRYNESEIRDQRSDIRDIKNEI